MGAFAHMDFRCDCGRCVFCYLDWRKDSKRKMVTPRFQSRTPHIDNKQEGAMQYEKEIVLYCCWSVSCSGLPPFVLLSSVASSVGNKECPAEFQSSAGRFAIKCFGSEIVSGNQFLILLCISSTIWCSGLTRIILADLPQLANRLTKGLLRKPYNSLLSYQRRRTGITELLKTAKKRYYK